MLIKLDVDIFLLVFNINCTQAKLINSGEPNAKLLFYNELFVSIHVKHQEYT